MIILLLLASIASAQPEASWSSDQTLHFVIHHENPDSSLGTNNLVERIYEALHPALWTLTPWMTQTKIDVYLYHDRESFLKGRFHPPAWSGGLMSESANEKALAVYEPLDTGVAAHELTHLYFHTFFDEKSVSPPAWLDEGLAMDLQNDALTLSDPREMGPVISTPMPMKTLLSARPAPDTAASRVNAWYRQAHSVVRFLRRGHVESLFADYCGKLRDGGDPEASLLAVYGYADLDAFEQAWLKWRPKKAKGQPAGLEP